MIYESIPFNDFFNGVNGDEQKLYAYILSGKDTNIITRNQFSKDTNIITGHKWRAFKKNLNIDFEMFTKICEMGIIDAFEICNKMVKNPDCPRKLSNYFYSKKHSLIKRLYETGKAEVVGYDKVKKVILFKVGESYFHQPKNYFTTLDTGSLPEMPYQKSEEISIDVDFIGMTLFIYRLWSTLDYTKIPSKYGVSKLFGSFEKYTKVSNL